MIDLTRNRRKIFAFTGLFVLLLAAVLLLLPPEISPALGGGVGLEYRIHAVFNDEEEQQLAESSLIQTASDTLGLPVVSWSRPRPRKTCGCSSCGWTPPTRSHMMTSRI